VRKEYEVWLAAELKQLDKLATNVLEMETRANSNCTSSEDLRVRGIAAFQAAGVLLRQVIPVHDIFRSELHRIAYMSCGMEVLISAQYLSQTPRLLEAKEKFRSAAGLGDVSDIKVDIVIPPQLACGTLANHAKVPAIDLLAIVIEFTTSAVAYKIVSEFSVTHERDTIFTLRLCRGPEVCLPQDIDELSRHLIEGRTFDYFNSSEFPATVDVRSSDRPPMELPEVDFVLMDSALRCMSCLSTKRRYAALGTPTPAPTEPYSVAVVLGFGEIDARLDDKLVEINRSPAFDVSWHRISVARESQPKTTADGRGFVFDVGIYQKNQGQLTDLKASEWTVSFSAKATLTALIDANGYLSIEHTGGLRDLGAHVEFPNIPGANADLSWVPGAAGEFNKFGSISLGHVLTMPLRIGRISKVIPYWDRLVLCLE
jgi:hypothetical protein